MAVKHLACIAQVDGSSSDKLGTLVSQYARNRFFAPLKTPILLSKKFGFTKFLKSSNFRITEAPL